jgi:alcohol dehydrogenase (cytochrome c)
VAEGDNLYTSSLLALDLDTGVMAFSSPHDTHDWDAQSWPVLLDLGGKVSREVSSTC